MANWLITTNNSKVNLSDIPTLKINDLRGEIISLNKRPVGFFGKDWGYGQTKLFVILADDENAKLYISSALFSDNEKSYVCITSEIPAFHIFER